MPSSRRFPFTLVAASLLAVTGIAAAPGVVLASELRMTMEKPRFTCEARSASLSHVALRPVRRPAAPAPLPCCDGQFGCAQFLPTSTVLPHPRRYDS